MAGDVVALAMAWSVTGGSIGALLGRRRGLGGAGLPLGLLLGPLAWPILFAATPTPATVPQPARPPRLRVPATSGVRRRPVRPRVHPDVVAALQSPRWTVEGGHLTCRPHVTRYCPDCATDLG